MPLGSLFGGLGAAAGGGNLGTLFISLRADVSGMTSGFRQAEALVLGSTRSIGAAAVGMAVTVTAALATIATASVVQFGKFEKQMAKSTAIMTDLNTSLREELEATARQIATESVTSADKLAEAYFFMTSAGFSAKQSIAALSAVNNFAIAGQFDLSRATTLAADAQTALGLRSKDAQENLENMVRVTDVLVKANTLANATVEQFSFALTRQAGAAMKSFGIELEEGVAVLAAFADQGIKAELAGTSYARVLRLMTTAAVKNAEVYREMGIAVFDASGNLRNMADIVADMEVAFKGMTDEQRVAALDMLGFKARVQQAILPLLGTSQAIRDYERALRSAAGTTEEVAKKQMQNFFDQLTITWNRIKDILITIGGELAPVLMALNSILQETVGTNKDFNESMKGWASHIGPAVVSTIGVIGDAIYYMGVGIKGLPLIFFSTARVIIEVFEDMANKVIDEINRIIKQLNKLPKVDIPGIQRIETLALARMAIGQLEDEALDEMGRMVLAGSFSDRLMEKYDEATKSIEESNRKIIHSIRETTKESNNLIQQIGFSEATKDINEMFKSAFGDENQGGNFSIPVSDPLTAEIQNLKSQQSLAEENLAILEGIKEQELKLTEDTINKKLQLQHAYTEQVRALQLAQAQIILGSAQSIFDDLAGITESFGGRQTGIYKALFAASKAFAIAESTVKIAQGIAAAASLPFPANLPAIASVVAATAGIISSIQSVQLEFGGGRARGGPVTPGKAFLVGEEGPEPFVPSSAGTILPNDFMSGSKVNVVIHNYTDSTAQVQERNDGNEKTIEVIIAKTKNSIAADINEGRGNITKSMQSSFGLRRAGR